MRKSRLERDVWVSQTVALGPGLSALSKIYHHCICKDKLAQNLGNIVLNKLVILCCLQKNWLSVCEKPSNLISYYFPNDGEILSIAYFDSGGNFHLVHPRECTIQRVLGCTLSNCKKIIACGLYQFVRCCLFKWWSIWRRIVSVIWCSVRPAYSNTIMWWPSGPSHTIWTLHFWSCHYRKRDSSLLEHTVLCIWDIILCQNYPWRRNG